MNDPKYPQWNARIKKWDILLSSMTRELGFVTYVSVFNASKNAVHVDNTHLHHTFYIKLKKMIVGYFKTKQMQNVEPGFKEQKRNASRKNWTLIYPMRGDPFYQKTLPTLDTNFDCIRTKKITHMCEYFRQATRMKRFHVKDINWKSHWASTRSKNIYAFKNRFSKCVVVGGSSFPTLYDYSQYYAEADAVFVINGLRPWFNFSSKVNAKVYETFDEDHYNHDVRAKTLLRGGKRYKAIDPSRLALSSWKDLSRY